MFEEVFKLFFIKLWDEEQASDDPQDNSSICRFRITADTPEKQAPRFQALLAEASRSYPDIFPIGTTFDLSPQALMVAASVLERIRLTDTDLELIDLTFEYLMSPESKGDKGQYFTPRQVVRMAVKMLNPKSNESLLDPACGPCGFPLMSLVHVRDQEIRRKWKHNWESRLQQYGQRYLFAADFDGRVVRVAKFMMRLAGDGRTNVFRMNSLDKREWMQDQQYQRQIGEQLFDLIMTNPPFAGTIRHPQILNLYDLAFTETRKQTGNKEELHVVRERKLQSNQTRDVLFLDYCLNKLKPGGRMAIVLPQGHFNNISAEQTRRYIMSKARILAVVGLHVNAFKPHTGTKTSVLFVQRWTGKEAEAWQNWYEALYEYDRQVTEYNALCRWREKELKNKKIASQLPKQIRSEPVHPGDPPPPPGDYPIFFATSQRSGRDNSGAYDYLKDGDGHYALHPKVVLAHDEEGERVEIEQMRRVLNTDLDEIADAFLAWGQEQRIDFLADSPYRGRAFSEFAVGADFHLSTISVHDLERTRRIDPEYYHPDYLILETQLDAVPSQRLDSVCQISDGNHFAISEQFLSDGEHLYLRGKDLNSFFLERVAEDAVYIPQNVFDGLKKSHMYPLDVLVSVVGTIGSIGMIPADWPTVAGSCKLAILRANDINPYYLAAFFSSRYGQFQLKRNMRGALQMGVTLEDLPLLRVYKPTPEQQAEIAHIVQQAYAQTQASKRLYGEAEQMLLDALGVHSLNLSHEIHNVGTLSEAWEARRIDPDYFQPKYYRVMQAIRHSGLKTHYLGNLIEPIRNGFDYREYIEVGTPYIRVGDIKGGRIDIEGAAKVAITPNQIKKDVGIQVNDVLFTRKGTFGQSAVVREEQLQSIISSEIMLLRLLKSTPILPDYLATFLNSNLGYQQVERKVHGLAYFSIAQDDLANVEIPELPQTSQEAIGKVVKQSLQVEREAKRLLEEAKLRVEQMIQAAS